MSKIIINWHIFFAVVITLFVLSMNIFSPKRKIKRNAKILKDIDSAQP